MRKRKILKVKKAVCCPDLDLPSVREDFRETFSWRIFRIMTEFVDGFQFISDFKKTRAIFDSTRVQKKDFAIFRLVNSVKEVYKIIKKSLK